MNKDFVNQHYEFDDEDNQWPIDALTWNYY